MESSDEKKLVRLLKQFRPGFLPHDVFVQIARLCVLSIIEFVPLRLNKEGEVEVLLLPRANDDPIWPGELHTPGTVMRPTDTDGKINLAFERILKEELLGTEVSNPYFVGSTFHKSKRGTEHPRVFWIEVTGVAKTGAFYPVNNLPVNTMESQKVFIRQAAESYARAKTAQ